MVKEYPPASKTVDESLAGSDYLFRVEGKYDPATKKSVPKWLCMVTVRTEDGAEVPTAGQWCSDVLSAAEMTQLETIFDKLHVAATSGTEFKDQ